MKILLPLSWLYGLAMQCRNTAFDVGVLRSETIGVPVISIGNMTMGGTGKTPLVEYIVGRCLTKGRRVAVVSRGYGRASKGVVTVSDGTSLCVDAARGGDEPVQIARKFPKAIVVVGEKRVEAGRMAVEALHADVVILDDGFQHRYIRRDLDIVVLDSRQDVRTLPMIPAGTRREPLNALRRANTIAFSRYDETAEGNAWLGDVSSGFPGRTVHYRYSLEKVCRAGSEPQLPVTELKGVKVFLFSGIGDHTGFVSQMKRSGFEVAGDLAFSDHHIFTNADIKKVLDLAARAGAGALLTTEKDMVRLMANTVLFHETIRQCPLYHAGIVVDIVKGREMLDAMIDQCLTGSPV